VIIVGTGAGLSYAELGPTHHSCEDMAILRVLPDMQVLCPCDSVELRLGLRAALQQPYPVYIRIGKKGEPDIHQSEPDFAIGRAITLQSGDDVCLIGGGTIMPVVLAAAAELAAEGVRARVESFHTVKPLDTARLTELFGRYALVAVAEEHGLAGGLGGAVAEWLATCPTLPGRLLAFGTADAFLHETGSQDYARRHFGLTADNIAATVKRRLRGP
jgi:transketolase